MKFDVQQSFLFIDCEKFWIAWEIIPESYC